MAPLLTALLLALAWVPSAWALSASEKVELVEKRMVDLERVQNDQRKDFEAFKEKIEARLAQLQEAQKGFYSELDELRQDQRAITEEAERGQLSGRTLTAKIEELERKIEAQSVELFELKEILKTQAGKLAAEDRAEAFEEAMKVFKAGNWPKAQDQLLSLAAQAKDPDLAKEALYYGSFAAHVRKDWKAANQGFSDLLRLYPDSDRVPASTWRLALGLIAAGDPGAAKPLLKKLAASKEKDQAKLAAKARAKLKQLK